MSLKKLIKITLVYFTLILIYSYVSPDRTVKMTLFPALI